MKTLQWYYRTLLSLVSVPLSSSSKETEGLNVFATVSQCLSHGRIPPPNNSKSKAPPTCFSAVLHRKLLLLVGDASGLGVAASPWRVTLRLQVLLSPFSLDSRRARVASQPLVDDREDGMHQGQGRSRTWQQGRPCSGTQSVFPFLSVEHKSSGW